MNVCKGGRDVIGEFSVLLKACTLTTSLYCPSKL